jgi:soluble lytic murein transglycosylase-like protein
MQLGLSEARAMGYTGSAGGLLNPQSNIFWGSKYLKYCIDHKNTLEKGISGYNTGNVEKDSTPFNADYVNVVASYVPRFRYLLSQSFPGYATVFPKVAWLQTTTYA